MEASKIEIKKMSYKEIIKEIDEAYPKVKDLIKLMGMDKGGWIVASLFEEMRGEHKHFVRCENCIFHECKLIKNVKEELPPFVFELWFTHGCPTCRDFSPKPDAEGVP